MEYERSDAACGALDECEGQGRRRERSCQGRGGTSAGAARRAALRDVGLRAEAIPRAARRAAQRPDGEHAEHQRTDAPDAPEEREQAARLGIEAAKQASVCRWSEAGYYRYEVVLGLCFFYVLLLQLQLLSVCRIHRW